MTNEVTYWKSMPYADPEKAREYNRKKKLEYYYKNKQKYNLQRRKYKKTKPTKKKQKEYSRRYYLKNSTKIKQYSKEYRERKRGEVNARQRERNRRKDPTILINDLTRAYTRGDIGHAEYCRRMQQAIDRINEELKR